MRLAYLEAPRFEGGDGLRTGPIGPCAATIPQRQSTVPEMYLDVLASRLVYMMLRMRRCVWAQSLFVEYRATGQTLSYANAFRLLEETILSARKSLA